ncbi:MAG TPA: carboxypeptidase, partial [Candidatus Aminicenantes bacterium]|nr:carboxypeptidase [Candidatus Aminicenantes bacterium]
MPKLKSKHFYLSLIFIFLVLFSMTPPLGAEEKPAHNFLNLKEDIVSVTHHTIKINNQVIPYTATAGYITLRDEEGKGKANVFFTAYTREDIK